MFKKNGKLNECKRLKMWIKDGEYMGQDKLSKYIYLKKTKE